MGAIKTVKLKTLIMQEDLFHPFELEISWGSLKENFIIQVVQYTMSSWREQIVKTFIISSMSWPGTVSGTWSEGSLYSSPAVFFIDSIKCTSRKRCTPASCKLMKISRTRVQKITAHPSIHPSISFTDLSLMVTGGWSQCWNISQSNKATG